MNKLLFRLLVVSLCAIGGMSQALAAKRVALVIGNDAYEHVTKLQKAVNDAEAMGETLEAIGFKVQRARNIGRRDMNFQIQKFTAELEAGDEALFFFAGHGVEIHGRNYLLPTDIPQAVPGQENFVTAEAVPVDSILNRIRERGTRVSILVLDACRDNPFSKKGTRNLGGTRGLARMPAPEGSFIMYSAGVGQTALDRLAEGDPHRNSVFTRSLIPLLRIPGLSLTETARRVRRDVQQLARTVSHQQRPAYYDEITGSFYFVGSKASPTRETPQSEPNGRTSPGQAWTTISETKNADDLRAFIKEYPASFFATLARARLNKLKQKKTALVRPPKPAVPAVHECDRLAAERFGTGISRTLRLADRIGACRAAVDAYPGVARFEFELGRALFTAQTDFEAAEWMRKAAQRGHVSSMYFLAIAFEKGRGVKKSRQESLGWYRQAADKGHTNSMFVMGLAYQFGHGVVQDHTEAAHWYRKAAEAGNTSAMTNLAMSYQIGRGVQKDVSASVRWLRKAADQGGGRAMNNLGFAYKRGIGVRKDLQESLRWMRKAAEKGETTAMFNVGIAIEYGEGTARDAKEGAKWVFKALSGGDDYAVEQLEKNHGLFSSRFRRELQRLMKEHGAYSGAIDGQFGPGTKRAIRELAKK